MICVLANAKQLQVCKRTNFRSGLAWAQSRTFSEYNFCKGNEELPQKTIRWGIAPISLMAEDFATALKVLPKGQHCIKSCVDAYRSQATAFANKHRVPNVYTSFEDLAHCPHVDAVYISPLNGMHCELCHLMLNHDKHVLCEQPLCMTEQQVAELVAKAKARGLFLMEGMWPRCMPAYHILQKEIMSQKLGKIYQMDCTLGWQLPTKHARGTSYSGVARDLGRYAIQLALWVYREVPEYIRVQGKLNDEGIDMTAFIELIFKGKRCARLFLSAENKLCNTVMIRGTKGIVTMSNPLCPEKMSFENTDFEFILPKRAPPTNYNNLIGLCYTAEEVRNCILDGKTESELFNHNESRLMANLINQIQEMLGTVSEKIEIQQKQAI